MVTNETLAKLDLFEGLSDEVLLSIAALCREVSFEAEASIFAMGHAANDIYLLLEGTVRLVVYPTALPEPMTLTLLKTPGQAFGWSALVGSGHYTAVAQAVTDVRAIAIEGRALMGYLARKPEVGFVLMTRIAQVVSQRLGFMRRLLLDTVRECDSLAQAVREN